MGYILAEILACLLLAGLLGGLIGWWIRGGNKKEIEALRSELDACERESRAKIEDLTQHYEQKLQLEHDMWNKKLKVLEDEYSTKDTISNQSQHLVQDNRYTENLVDHDNTRKIKDHMVECYELEDIPGIGAGFAIRLKKRGIFDSCYLANKFLNDDEATKKMAKKLDIDFQTLRAWAIMSDLMKHPKISGDYAEILQSVGVRSREELRNADTYHLFSQVKDYIERYPTPDNLAHPSLEMIIEWVEFLKYS